MLIVYNFSFLNCTSTADDQHVAMYDRKCISLFVTAFCSTVTSYFVSGRLLAVPGCLDMVPLLLDLSMNAVCLYLQFHFTKAMYVRCCKYPDSCCRWCIGFRIKRWTKKNCKEDNKISVESCSPSASAVSESPKALELDSENVTV